jgi:hypothetical protein
VEPFVALNTLHPSRKPMLHCTIKGLFVLPGNKVTLQAGVSASNSASCGTKVMINPMIRIPNQPTRDTSAKAK